MIFGVGIPGVDHALIGPRLWQTRECISANRPSEDYGCDASRYLGISPYSSSRKVQRENGVWYLGDRGLGVDIHLSISASLSLISLSLSHYLYLTLLPLVTYPFGSLASVKMRSGQCSRDKPVAQSAHLKDHTPAVPAQGRF